VECPTHRLGREQEIIPGVVASIHTRAILASFHFEDSAIVDAAQLIALWPTKSADRENLVRQQAMLVEIHDTIRHTSEMILSSQELIRQLDWMSHAAWHHPSNEDPYPQKETV
jgi:hypothetical protein